MPKTHMQNNNMSVTYCFLLADFLLGISAEKRDRETADSLPARGRGEAQESNGLHHVHDQCCCFQRSRRWATQPTNQRKNPTSWWGNFRQFCPCLSCPGPSCIITKVNKNACSGSFAKYMMYQVLQDHYCILFKAEWSYSLLITESKLTQA